MIVTIVRHGKAGDATRDEDRELTDRGIDDISFCSHQFRDLCNDKSLPLPDKILHSAWRRTTQTAEMLAAAFTVPLEALDALLPGQGVGKVDRSLAVLPPNLSHCVLVGHQPMVSSLVDYYLDDGGRVPSLSPGGLVSLSLNEPGRGCGKLQFWAMPPEYQGYVS